MSTKQPVPTDVWSLDHRGSRHALGRTTDGRFAIWDLSLGGPPLERFEAGTTEAERQQAWDAARNRFSILEGTAHSELERVSGRRVFWWLRLGRNPLFAFSGWAIVFLVAAVLIWVIVAGDASQLHEERDELAASLTDTERRLAAMQELAQERSYEIIALEDRVDELESPAAPQPPPPPPSPEPAPAPPPTEPQGTGLVEFSGTGIQSTRPFTAPDGWEVQWQAQGDIFQIYLNTEGGEFVNILANESNCPCRGSSFVGQGGRFYLEMNAVGSWTVRAIDV
jgi:hypothetical protein